MTSILFEAHHPSHVLFAYALREKLDQHKIKLNIILQSRPEAVELAKELELDFVSYPARKRGLFPSITNLLQGWNAVFNAITENKPNLVVSISGVYTAFPSKLYGIKNILFTDTETAAMSHLLSYPFADKIFLPSSYRTELDNFSFLSKSKLIQYEGHQETAYMTSESFLKKVSQYEVPKESYAFIRAIAWGAYHEDKNIGNWSEIIEILKKKGINNIVASCETDPPPELQLFTMNMTSLKYHSYLKNAAIVITEGATTATEASYYRVPALFINKNLYGNIKDGVINERLLYAENRIEAAKLLQDINIDEIKTQSNRATIYKTNPIELILKELC